jgi:hypothetical protein
VVAARHSDAAGAAGAVGARDGTDRRAFELRRNCVQAIRGGKMNGTAISPFRAEEPRSKRWTANRQ